MSGWCAKFVQGYAKIVSPLNKLRQKDVKWDWSELCERAFLTLKEAISTAVSLTIPDFDSPFEIHTDASSTGLGAVLMQRNKESDTKVIAFASKSLKGAERNYSATELECLAVVWAFEKWRPYIESSHITVFTDHQALVWMLRNKTLKGKLLRWALRLQEFDYVVHYRPGVQNVIPDALSRSTSVCVVDYDNNVCFHQDCRGDPAKVVNWVQFDSCDKWYHCHCLDMTLEDAKKLDEFICPQCEPSPPQNMQASMDSDKDSKVSSVLPDLNEFIMCQHRDTTLSSIIQKLQETTPTTDKIHQNFLLEDGVLRYQTTKTKGSKLVVPKELVHRVIFHFHCTPTCPHLGIRKTVGRILGNYWWKELRRDVEAFIKRCHSCQFIKPVYQKPGGFMQSTVSTYPWEILAMDLIGPFPESQSGNMYVLVVTDHFTRFSLLYTLKRATGKVIVSVLTQLFCTWGACRCLVSDNGPQMISKHVVELCTFWGVKRILTTPYHPQTNWVERVNRNLVSMLCCFVHGDHTEWDKYIAEFMFALNSFCHDSTGYSPAELFLYRKLQGPGEPVEEPCVTAHTTGMYEKARKTMAKINKSNKRAYDQKRLCVNIKTGDKVLLKSHPLSNLRRKFSAKLAPKWRGPYDVISQVSPVNFVIQAGADKRVAHVEQLKVIAV
ncbi:hypothetical protein HOLleu_17347 [Holothuria leucospilota]|uniref:Integrase catalytic domain-containing protein n=1 Tax=Holothuria leucospilota TaxID=206669 RepID=A0A9Q1HBP5_HOLLE|nr:hypothetical protein HOLleu_17347 [Holothuria leucospilota]